MNEQPKQEPQNQQNQSQTQQGQASQQQTKKHHSNKRYYHRKSFRPRPQEQSQQQQLPIQKVAFKKVSIVVPFLDEEESLRPLYSEIKRIIKGISSDYEIIFVDDGSKDKSLSLVKDLARMDNKIRFYSFQTNYGKSAA
ncbi:MAG: glycosyltransferase, partial [Bacteroidetes bacterium]|nr:glycosyltransferase [Bacteroidota bacterium]